MPQLSFKLFVSSTFVDFQHERSWLHNTVFPQIKQKCEQYGIDFQSVDLRWGVSQEAGLDQDTMDICLNELGHCRDVSENPFLLVLLGDRYGWRPLPNRVSAESILAWVNDMGESDSALFNRWYRLDNNTGKPSYFLRSRRGLCEDDVAWYECEKQMREALDKVLENRPQYEQELYSFSATHHEIVNGLADDGKNNCLVIQRKIRAQSNLPAYFADRGETRAKQTQLGASIAEEVDNARFYALDADWEQDGFNCDYQAHFCQAVLEQFDLALNSLIKKGTDTFSMVERHQQAFAASLTNYVARPKVEQKILDAIARSDGKPAVLVGAGGTGKSSLMTGVAAQSKTENIIRYIGLDQESCQSRLILDSLLQEIGYKYGQKVIENLPDRESEKLTLVLNRIPTDKPLTLYIDALDRIDYQNGDVWFSWLPLQLPPHVKVLVSVIAGGVAERLQGLLDTVDFLVIDNLDQEDATIMLEQWMAGFGRKLQPEQSKQVIALATTHPAPPLMLKMTSIAAQFWDHRHQPDFLSTNNEEMVADIYKLLAHKRHHGIELTKAVVGLIALSRGGIPESVLLAMLDKFKPVMDEYRVRYPFSPETEGLPAIIWSRLRLDMGSLLLEHQENGERVLYFSHQQFVTQTQSILCVEYQAQLRALMIGHYSDRTHFPLWFKTVANPNQFVLKELPWQLQHAQAFEGLSALISDVSFLMAKCAAAQLDNLLDTFVWLRKSGLSDAVMEKTERFLIKLYAMSEKSVPCHKLFLQNSYELPAQHPLKLKIKRWLNDGHCDWLWIASKHPLAALESAIELNCDVSEVTAYHAVNDSLFAMGVKGGVVQLIDAHTARLITELIGHRQPVKMMLNGCGNDLVTVSSDDTVRVWDIDTGREILCISSDSAPCSVCLIGSDQLVIQQTHKVTIYDCRSGKVVVSREIHPQPVQIEEMFDPSEALPKSSFSSNMKNLNFKIRFGGMLVQNDKILCWTMQGILVLNATDLSTISASNYQDSLREVVWGRDGIVNIVTMHHALLSYDVNQHCFNELTSGSGFSGFHHINKQRYLLWHGEESGDDNIDVTYQLVDLEDWKLATTKKITVPRYEPFFRQAVSSVYRKVLQSCEDSLVLVTMSSAYQLDLTTSELTVLFIHDDLHKSLSHAFMLDSDRIAMTRIAGEVFIYSIAKRAIVCELSPWLGSIDFMRTHQVTDNIWLMQIEKSNPFLFDKQWFIEELDGEQLRAVKGQKVAAVTSFGDGYTAEVVRPELHIEHVYIYSSEMPDDASIRQAGHNLSWQKEDKKPSILTTHIRPFGSLIIAWGENGRVTLRSAHSSEPIASWQTQECNIKKVEVLSASKERFTNGVTEAAPIAVAIMTQDHRAYCWLPLIKESIELVSPHLYEDFTSNEQHLVVYGDSCFTLFDTSKVTYGYCQKVFAHDHSEYEENSGQKLQFAQPIPNDGVFSKFYNRERKQTTLMAEFVAENNENVEIASAGDVRLFPLEGVGVGYAGISKENNQEFGLFHFASGLFHSYRTETPVIKMSLAEDERLLLETATSRSYLYWDDAESNLKYYQGANKAKPKSRKIRRYNDMLRYTPSGQVQSANSVEWLHSKPLNYIEENSDGTIVVHNSVKQAIILQGYLGNQPIPLNQLTDEQIQSNTVSTLHKKAEIDSIKVCLQQLSQLINAADFNQAFLVLKLVDEKLRAQREFLPADLFALRTHYYLQLVVWTQPAQKEVAEGLVELQRMLLKTMEEQQVDLRSVLYVTQMLLPLSNFSQSSDESLIQFLSQLQGDNGSPDSDYENQLYDMWMLVVEKLLASYPENIHRYKVDLISAVTRLQNIGLNSVSKSVWEMRIQWLVQALKRRELSADGGELDNSVRPLPDKFHALQQKAESGDAMAWLNIGILWGRGDEIDKDLNQARVCYEKSVELGSTDALFNLYQMYRTGDGVKKNIEKSVEYLMLGAEQGHVSSQTNLGGAYLTGDLGLKKNWDQAVHWLELAVNDGDEMAMVNLAAAYSLYAPEHLTDLKKALDYLSLPLNKGHTSALRLYEHLKRNA